MAIQEFFNSITERLQSTANVKTVFGEPIVADGKRVVPVARVAYGFGGGGGSRGGKSAAQEKGDEGGGGGGGCAVIPVGVVEITQHSTRFISFKLTRKLIAGVAAGLLLGYLMGRCRKKLV
ncbi:MAG: GerW family sporulation protein [Terriglobia bacterium]